jgi:nucleotide-binding universal stress UspA family protein
MKLVIGVIDDDTSIDAMAAGAMVARSTGGEPLLVNIHPAAYEYVSHGHVDAEWEQFMHSQARKIAEDARNRFAERFDWPGARIGVHGNRSSGHGLSEYARAEGADAIVIGAAPGGSVGRFHLGSTANQLLHGSHLPVITAPSGLRRSSPERIGRVIVAFEAGREGEAALKRGAELARACGVGLLVLTIVVRHRMFASNLGADAEGQVLTATIAQLDDEQRKALAHIDTAGLHIEHMVEVGDSVIDAMNRLEWDSSDLLVVGSSRGLLARVFLGDINHKIIRSTPVATMVLPRHT